MKRRLPVGAELLPTDGSGGGGAHFRVWAPKRKRVEVAIDDAFFPLASERDGYFAGIVESARRGTRYRYRLDGEGLFPDPASRYQPDGPHGPSEIIDPSIFTWTDDDRPGLGPHGQVLYEMHIGTFTADGTFAAAAERLGDLAAIGVTAIEVMPIADFPGRFGWGYDGVLWFAPYHGYGTPDDFRAFVNRAHAEGLGVILDVVYNHFGPDGNYLREYSDWYFNHDRRTDWGDAISYDGEHSAAVRELAISNAGYWISEFHLDGLRLDATDNVYDASSPHVLAQIGQAARAAAGKRPIIIVAENEAQHSELVRAPKQGGHGLDMLWNDDFHHTALVAATGKREAYLSDYRGSPQEFVSACKYGYLYQGQFYSWQMNRRGYSSHDISPHRFVHFIENHDQVANSLDGRRLHQLTSPGVYRALTALTLLGRQTPMLFQGEEFGSSAPFLFFADHHEELAKLVYKGRRAFLEQFPSLLQPESQAAIPDPGESRTFERCRLDWSEREANTSHLALHRDLITLRRCDPVLSREDARMDGAVLGQHAFVLRWFGGDEADRLLVINLGTELALDVAPEPLLASPYRDRGWTRLWHSEELCYGGRGAPSPESEIGSWRIPAESATLLTSDE
jgi:maltooligosyltrehalose trehalohydrolase